jgi:hypothetical protein
VPVVVAWIVLFAGFVAFAALAPEPRSSCSAM